MQKDDEVIPSLEEAISRLQVINQGMAGRFTATLLFYHNERGSANQYY